MNLILQSSTTYNNQLTESFNVTDGLDLEKTAIYAANLMNSGAVFYGAEIHSNSDKDSRVNFSGYELYSSYDAFMAMLRSNNLNAEKGVYVVLKVEEKDVPKRITLFLDKDQIRIVTPAYKEVDAPSGPAMKM